MLNLHRNANQTTKKKTFQLSDITTGRFQLSTPEKYMETGLANTANNI